MEEQIAIVPNSTHLKCSLYFALKEEGLATVHIHHVFL